MFPEMKSKETLGLEGKHIQLTSFLRDHTLQEVICYIFRLSYCKNKQNGVRCYNCVIISRLGYISIDHFTVVNLVAWPLNGSEAEVDLVLIQTSLLLLCKSSCSYANYVAFT